MVRNIKALIIEDEAAAVRRLKKELQQIETVHIEILEVCESVDDAVSLLTEKDDFELIFIDIHLTDGLSFEIFKQVKVPCPVIFTTAYDDYAIQAFKVNSIDYLLKPIDPEELRNAIDNYLTQSTTERSPYENQLMKVAAALRPVTYRSSFLVSYRQKMLMIDVNDVAYFYIKERGVFLKKKDGADYVVDFFLDDLEQQLDPSKFYRANRQFLVARAAIREIESYFHGRLILAVEPEATGPVIISKEKATNFKRWADY